MTLLQAKSKKEVRAKLIEMGMGIVKTDLFLATHAQQPEVWKNFEKMALHLVQTRRSNFGAKEIFESLRRGCDEIQIKAHDFKLNNNWTPYYARVFTIFHPEYKHRIQLREISGVNSQGRIAA